MEEQERKQNPKIKRKPKIVLNPLNTGCLTLSLLIGLMIGLRGTRGILPEWLNWIIGGLFVVFFAVLSLVMTGIATRREDTEKQEKLLINSGSLLRSLKTFIMSNNPSSSMDISSLSAFDQDMAILDEFAIKLERRQELDQEETQILKNITDQWLSAQQFDQWYRYTKVGKGNEN